MKKSNSQPKKLSIKNFILLVLVYLAIIKLIGLWVSSNVSLSSGHRLGTISDVLWSMWLPLGAALVFVFGIIAALGWWKPVFHETKQVRKWVWVVPIVFAVCIFLAINYGGLAEKGIWFTLVLFIACQFVGWGEEGMFRGVGVQTLRQNGLTEAKVALWSSVIFGLVHITNVIGGNPKAFVQALIVSFAGYFFYLIRRVSGSNVLNSILHGMFDFAIISGAGLVLVNDTMYAGTLAAILAYIIIGAILLIRRRKIELPKSVPQNA